MTDPRIVEFWGKKNLHVWPCNSLDALGLSQRTRDYLLQTGMPHSDDWTLSFETPSLQARLTSRPNYLVLGFDDTVPISLDWSRGEIIVAVEDESADPFHDRYLNKDVIALGASLMAYERYRRDVTRADDDRAQILVERTRSEIAVADASALEDQSHYWALIIEQMRHGLL